MKTKKMQLNNERASTLDERALTLENYQQQIYCMHYFSQIPCK